MSQTIHTNQFLTNFATGYTLEKPVADFVAPPMKVMRPSDKYVEYTKSQLRIFNGLVKGREEAKEIQWDLGEGTYSCDEYSLSYFVLDRLARNADKPINLETDAVKQLKLSMALAREYRIVSIAGSQSFVTNGIDASGDWDTIASGTPVADLLTGMAAVESANGGKLANRVVIPTAVGLAAVTTTEWKSFFQYTDTGFKNGLFNVVSGLRNIGLEPMLTGVQGLNTAKGTGSDPVSENLWSDNVLLFYCEATPTLQTRTFMYSPFTYRDMVERIAKPENRGNKIIMSEEIDELLVDASCGYLIRNCL